MKTNLLIGALFLVACTSSPQPTATPLLDPTGHWNMTMTFDSGDCGMTGSSKETLEVVPDGGGYGIAAVIKGQTVDGSLTEDEISATLDVIVDAPVLDNSPDPWTFTLDAVADSQGTIDGYGDVGSMDGSNGCSQVFTVAGTLAR
jgi:hypothetical protein